MPPSLVLLPLFWYWFLKLGCRQPPVPSVPPPDLASIPHSAIVAARPVGKRTTALRRLCQCGRFDCDFARITNMNCDPTVAGCGLCRFIQLLSAFGRKLLNIGVACLVLILEGLFQVGPVAVSACHETPAFNASGNRSTRPVSWTF